MAWSPTTSHQSRKVPDTAVAPIGGGASPPARCSLDQRRVGRDTGRVAHRVVCPEFVGRAEELDFLGAIVDQVADGRAATVIVGGDAGIGKSRLVEEFCHQRRGQGVVVARGFCIPVEGGGLPYGPVVGILRDLVRQLGESVVGGALDLVVSGLGVSGGRGYRDPVALYSAMPHLVDQLAKTRLFESILGCLSTVAERSPIVVVVEDLQWADSASAELITFLTRNLTDTRTLVIGTYRQEEVGHDHPRRGWLRELARHHRVTQIRLDGLAPGETALMIGGILGHPPDWALVEAVWARSEGNAFFVEELTAARHSTSLSVELQGVIMTRVDSLSAKAQQLLRIAATIGATTDHELLVTVCGFDGDALDRLLAELVDQHVLVVAPSRAGYQFRHALLREAIYGSLLPGERGRLHRQVAMALSAGGSSGQRWARRDTAELAAHWWAAGEWSEAWVASVAAAEEAVAVWAFPEALAQLDRALVALDRVPTSAWPGPAVRLEVLEKASDVAYLGDQGQRSIDLVRAAINSTDAAAEPSRVARYYALLGRNSWAIGDTEAAFDAYHKAAALVPSDRPSLELARVLAEEARGLMMMSRFHESEIQCHAALTVARAVKARAEECHSSYTLGCCRALLGHYDEGIALVRQALVIAEELGSADDLNRVYMGLSALLVESGRLEDAAALVFDSVAVGEKLWGVRLNGAAGNSVDALIRLGRCDQARALLTQAGERGIGSCAAQPSLLGATIALRQGRFDEAVSLLATAAELTARLRDLQTRGLFHLISAELALEQGRSDEAYDEVERALALAAGTDDESFRLQAYALGVRALADRMEEAQVSGKRFDGDKARLLARALVDEAEMLVKAPVDRGGACTPRARAQASLCAAEQSRLYRSDPDPWEDAGSLWAAAGEPYPTAYCRWRLAEAVLESRAGRGGANECLQQAFQASVDQGASPLKARIERLAQRARIQLHEVDREEPAGGSTVASDLGLTPREVEVLGQLAIGKTDREIADSLFISRKTVSVHVSNLMRKLDVSNRVEAGRIGQRHRLGEGLPQSGNTKLQIAHGP